MNERIQIEFPKRFVPSKEAFEDLGFEFKVVNGLHKAVLPNDWTIVINDEKEISFCDEQGLKRGEFTDNIAVLTALYRLHTNIIKQDEFTTTMEVIFGNEFKKICTIGTVVIDNTSYDTYENGIEELNNLYRLGENIRNEFYKSNDLCVKKRVRKKKEI